MVLTPRRTDFLRQQMTKPVNPRNLARVPRSKVCNAKANGANFHHELAWDKESESTWRPTRCQVPEGQFDGLGFRV